MSGVISKRSITRVLGISTGVCLLAACAQTPKHTNTLMFATNTDWGVKVGTDEKEIPVIRIGYTRQEGAFVPVLANTAVDGDGKLIPCPSAIIDKNGKPTKVEIANLEACKFVGTHDGVNEDSYSTLASFGGKTGAEVGKGSAKANVAIAQYFATGIAAQYLAVTGGANIVSAGGDTEAKANAASNGAAAILEKEKANAGKQVEAIDTAVIAAKSILGKSTDAVTSANLATLAGKFVGSKCSQAELDKLDKRTVEQFLKELRAQKRNCLRVWGNKLKQ